MAFMLQACSCDEQDEQKLELRFIGDSDDEQPDFFRVYGLGGDGPILYPG
jgi:hypothetical protein